MTYLKINNNGKVVRQDESGLLANQVMLGFRTAILKVSLAGDEGFDLPLAGPKLLLCKQVYK